MELLIIFLVTGLILFFGGIYKLYRYVNMTDYPFVIGTSNTYEERMDPDSGQIIKKPIISYSINDKFYRKAGVGFFKMGRQYKIFYDPDNPKNAVVEGDNGIGHIVVGFIFLCITVVFYLVGIGVIK